METQVYRCAISNKPIPPDRVEALRMLGTPENRWTCVEHSIEKPRQGIFLGEAGTSKLLFVDKVYDNSVRTVFKAEREVSEEEDGLDEKPHHYSEKEIKYYAQYDETEKKTSSSP